MEHYLVGLSAETQLFYTQVAQCAQLPLEQVLSDVLFRLAGELSLEALATDRRYTALFTDEEVNEALTRLLEAGYYQL